MFQVVMSLASILLFAFLATMSALACFAFVAVEQLDLNRNPPEKPRASLRK
jgi:hypothetical protein